MVIAVKAVGLAVIALGVTIAINPGVFKAIMNFWRQGKKIYIVGALRFIFGITFIIAAPECRLPAIVSIFGILMIIGGAIIFIVGPQRMNILFGWWDKKAPLALRLMGILALLMGSLIFYSA